MHCKGVDSEESQAGGYNPVGKRGFFQVANVVDAQGDPVSGEGHLTGCVGMGTVSVVQHGRREQRSEKKDEPEGSQKREDTSTA